MSESLNKKYSEEQKREFIANADNKCSFFIEAGAGAGKTTLISERIADQIAKGAKLSEFVVITFTKAAAQELKSRILGTLLKKSHKTQCIKDGISGIDLMNISTIHSFCRKILVENAYAAGLSPTFEVSEDDNFEENSSRKAEFFKSWFHNIHEKEYYPELNDALVQIKELEDGNWYEILKKTFLNIADENESADNEYIFCPEIIEKPDEDLSPKEKLNNKAALFIKIAKYARKEYLEQSCAESLLLSNEDLLYRADKLIRENKDVLSALRSKYKKIYVDEFQDTNYTQADLVMRLASGICGDGDNYGMPNIQLFLVGDPKQSIYRFRSARVELFDKIKQQFINADDTCCFMSLDHNYRSNKPILDWVNPQYSRLFSENRFSGLPYTINYSFMEPNQDDEYPIKGVFKSNNTDVIALVEKLHEKGINYGDILIITRDTTPINNYVKAFNAKQIPTTVRGKIKPTETEALVNFAKLVKGLANYGNVIEHTAVKQELMGISISDYEKDFIFSDINKDFFDWYSNFRRWAGKDGKKGNALRPAALLRKLAEHPEYYCKKDVSETELRVIMIRVEQCVEYVLSHESGNFTAIADTMEKYIEKELKKELPLSNNEDAVRIMNVHQVKGLSGKIVILANRSIAKFTVGCDEDGKKYGGNKIHKNGKCYPVVPISQNLPSYLLNDDIVDVEKQNEDAEWLRLEYVAATRAKYALIFMSYEGKDWFAEEEYKIENNTNIPDIDAFCETLPPKTAKKTNFDPKYCRNALINNISYDVIIELSKPTKEYKTPSSTEKSGDTGYTKKDGGYIQEERVKKGLYKNIFGTTIHRAFELFVENHNLWSDGDNKKIREEAVVAALMAIAENDILPEQVNDYKEYITDKLVEYAQNIFPEIFKDAEKICCEYPFTYTYDNITVNGTMDLLVKYNDGSYGIYDYKSDSMNGIPADKFKENMKKKYAEQIKLYKEAVSKIDSTAAIKHTQLLHMYETEKGKIEV